MPTSGGLYFFASQQEVEDQPAIILIHGAGGTHLHWPYNLRRLNHHRIFAPDLPGHGKSEGLGEQSIDKYAQAIANWMDAAGIKKAIVGGHSMGGAIAQTLALQSPQKVSGLILVGTGSVLRVNPDLLEMLSNPATTPAALDLVTKWSYAPGTDPKLLAQVREQMDATRPAVMHGDYLACSKFDVTSQLSQIKTPTLILCGELDKMTPIHLSQQLQTSISGAKLVLIPEAGHMVMLEQPEAVAAAVIAFITNKS